METAARSVKNKLALKYIRDCPLNCASTCLRANSCLKIPTSNEPSKKKYKSPKYGSEEKGSSLCKCSILLDFIMSKNLRGL